MDTCKNSEKRYQWAIYVLLVVLGFFAGAFLQGERMKTQIVTNTVEIRTLKEGLGKIEAKLDQILAERE